MIAIIVSVIALITSGYTLWFFHTQGVLTSSPVPIAISTVALFLSGYTLYAVHLKPFQLKLEVGSPMLTNMKHSEVDEKYSLALILPITMINIGARGGSIKDILIKLSTANTAYPFWYLHPYFFATEYSEKALKETGRQIAIGSIYLQSKERQHRNIVFSPMHERTNIPLYPPDKPVLPFGEYTMTVFALDCSRSQHRKMEEVSFNFTQEMLSSFSRSPFVARLSDVTAARDRFFETHDKPDK
ncbi:MAG: hypothetical protein HY670_09595 [Chloroflexi bacterium]|nr:hypothetical protein [Chloroflexota bacterium]